MEANKIRDFLLYFKELVKDSEFVLTVVEGILTPYTNFDESINFLRYTESREEFKGISDNSGNILYIRYTNDPIVYTTQKTVIVPLMAVIALPLCSNVRLFVDYFVQRLRERLVVTGDLNITINPILVLKQEVGDKKIKSEIPLASVEFSIIVPQSNITCTINDFRCDCSSSSILTNC